MTSATMPETETQTVVASRTVTQARVPDSVSLLAGLAAQDVGSERSATKTMQPMPSLSLPPRNGRGVRVHNLMGDVSQSSTETTMSLGFVGNTWAGVGGWWFS